MSASLDRDFSVVVGHVGGGRVVRPRAATSMRDLRWLASADVHDADVPPLPQALVTGPSLLALLEVFPRGRLPPETAAALIDALVPPPDGTASLGRLRFDLDDGVFRWAGRAPHGRDEAFAPWRAAVIARLLDRHGPRFETMFARKPPATTPDLDELPWHEVDDGRRHLAGIVEASLRERLAAARAQREEWWMHDGAPPEPVVDEGIDRRRKAEQLFVQAEHDVLEGRVGAARMNAKLSSIYDPDHPRYVRVMRAMTL